MKGQFCPRCTPIASPARPASTQQRPRPFEHPPTYRAPPQLPGFQWASAATRHRSRQHQAAPPFTMAMSVASQRATHVAASRARPSSRRSARVTAFLSNSEGSSSAQVRGQVSTSAAASFAAFSALAQQPMRQEQGGATWLAQLRDLFSPASKPREEW